MSKFNKPITIIMGKSGVGKDTILNELVEKHGYNRGITWTTRPMRTGEQNGKDYFFTNKHTFTDMIIQGDFIEYKTYNTLVDNKKDTWYYGLNKEINGLDLSKNNVLILTYEGALKALQYFGSRNCKVIYLSCKDNIRKERAIKRGSFDSTEWERRLESDKIDFNWNIIKGIVDEVYYTDVEKVSDICKSIVEQGE